MPTLRPQGTHHYLKTDPEVFQRVVEGRKPWEIRKNDRCFAVGELVTIRETEHSGDAMKRGSPLKYTGREVDGKITYILSGYGLDPDWVVMTVEWQQPIYRQENRT